MPMSSGRLLSYYQIWFLYAGFLLVYISGLWIPLMENDSAQHASMAMRMALSGDFLHIYKGDQPYLDKPHMHFWLAALSMKCFGVNAIAYRIPALLCLALAAYSTKKLAELLYGSSEIGHLAALIFLSAQTIILSAHDVRTDAVLTGFIALALWQLLKFVRTQSIPAALAGGFAAALAFSSKGMMAVVIIGFCMLSYLLYAREWRRLFNLKFLLIAVAFIVGTLPVLYAYNFQFGNEGLRFILFNQSINRLNANGFKETSPDYFFFFHTLLWAFLPFSPAFYTGLFSRTAGFIRNRFRKVQGAEFFTVGGFWLVMLLFSFSKFKLPHYLNGLITVLALLTAAFLYGLYEKKQVKTAKILFIIQLVVMLLSVFGMGILMYFFTGIPNVAMYVLDVLLLAYLVFNAFKRVNVLRKYVFLSLLFSITLNIFLNTQFYPVLTQYQGSLQLAKFVHKRKLPLSKIYIINGYESWNFDFYTGRNTPRAEPSVLKPGDYLVLHEDNLKRLSRPYRIIRAETDFRITRLSVKFLNPATRSSTLSKMYMIQISN